MATIALVSCSKTKRGRSLPAKELYTSSLFTKQRRAAQSLADRWFILSAKYGLLEPDEVVAPYDETLKSKGKAARKAWADKVFASLRPHVRAGDEIIFLAGISYREFLAEQLKAIGCHIMVPLEGKSLGLQGRALAAVPNVQNGKAQLDRFYSIFERIRVVLNGGRVLGETNGKMEWPKFGVYFLQEPGEERKSMPGTPRFVRVGTHAVSKGSKSTLWNRLSTHRGRAGGGGQHRSSIFRLHIGAALLSRAGDTLVSWGKEQSAPKKITELEADVERRVSEYIGQMRVFWLDIDDPTGPSSDRAYIERNSIALLSRVGRYIDPPSKTWLGLHSPKEEIRSSGLWNINYVDEDPDPQFLDVLDAYVDVMVGARPRPSHSLAPSQWYPITSKAKQLGLFDDG